MERKVGKQYTMDDGCVLRVVDNTFSFIDQSGQTTVLCLSASCKKIITRLLGSLGEKVSYRELYSLYGKQHPDYEVDPARTLQHIKATIDPKIRPYIKPCYNKNTKTRGYHIPSCTAIEDVQLYSSAESAVPAITAEEATITIPTNIPLKHTATRPNTPDGVQSTEPVSFIYRKSQWRYKIMLLEDIPDDLLRLKNALEAVFENENRYEVDIIDCNGLRDAIILSRFNDIDLYILDCARRSESKSQIGDDWYCGGTFFNILVSECPEMLSFSKIIFYTKLPRQIVYRSFGTAIDIAQRSYGVIIDCYSKQENSLNYSTPMDIALTAKKHLDTLYARAISHLVV